MRKAQTQAPIYLNLTGAYVAPETHSLKDDVRLPMLEAFLTSLAETTKTSVGRGDYTLSKALRVFAQKTDPRILADNDVVIEVTSKIDPSKHEVCHVFKITTTPKCSK